VPALGQAALVPARVPELDAAGRDTIDDDAADAFRASGLLVLRGLLRPPELEALQRDTRALVERAAAERVRDLDWQYKPHPQSGRKVPFRVEYVVDKTASGKALLGHPFVLRSVEKLQGRDFLPTWDSLVFKLAGEGAAIEWHRDADASCNLPGIPIFNVDFYLDGSDETNCVWALPGSNRWSDAEAAAEVGRRNRGGGFVTEGAIPVPLAAGDALLHDVLLVHGSPPSSTGLRRVVYYEFRPVRAELELGPHVPAYVPLKQRVLLACLRHRAATPQARAEAPFVYRPSAALAPPPLVEGEALATYRYAHHEYWRRRG
jgi:ectoine hydroxylase-related dioxygenase (phytanoyl-CoA dioxygenase family)